MELSTIVYEKQGGVVRLTLNRPEAFNAINVPMAKDLHAAVAAIDADAGRAGGRADGGGQGVLRRGGRGGLLEAAGDGHRGAHQGDYALSARGDFADDAAAGAGGGGDQRRSRRAGGWGWRWRRTCRWRGEREVP
jgi:enoyl-CoA hydratase/carnithine racemase